jgi:hypothetical protein
MKNIFTLETGVRTVDPLKFAWHKNIPFFKWIYFYLKNKIILNLNLLNFTWILIDERNFKRILKNQ